MRLLYREEGKGGLMGSVVRGLARVDGEIVENDFV